MITGWNVIARHNYLEYRDLNVKYSKKEKAVAAAKDILNEMGGSYNSIIVQAEGDKKEFVIIK